MKCLFREQLPLFNSFIIIMDALFCRQFDFCFFTIIFLILGNASRQSRIIYKNHKRYANTKSFSKYFCDKKKKKYGGESKGKLSTSKKAHVCNKDSFRFFRFMAYQPL